MAALSDFPELVGFFSYSREDDEDSMGALSALRERIQRELRAQLGRSSKTFRLWQDREAIAPGKLWEDAIRGAVGQAAFFIPIVTPTAVKSPFCQFEFNAFLDRERELGRSDLVFPILYIRVPELEDAGELRGDAVLSKVAKRQYVDWRALRNRNVNTDEHFKEAIAEFCAHIVDTLRMAMALPAARGEKRELGAAVEWPRGAPEAETIVRESEERPEPPPGQGLAAMEPATADVVLPTADETRPGPKAESAPSPVAAQPPEGASGRGAARDKPRSTLQLVLLPWRRIDTVAQARALTVFGALCVTAFATLAVVGAFMVAVFSQQMGAAEAGTVIAGGGVFLAVCAVGMYFGSRLAAITAFVVCAPAAAILTFMPPYVVMPAFLLGAFAGIRGTRASARLGRRRDGSRWGRSPRAATIGGIVVANLLSVAMPLGIIGILYIYLTILKHDNVVSFEVWVDVISENRYPTGWANPKIPEVAFFLYAVASGFVFGIISYLGGAGVAKWLNPRFSRLAIVISLAVFAALLALVGRTAADFETLAAFIVGSLLVCFGTEIERYVKKLTAGRMGASPPRSGAGP